MTEQLSLITELDRVIEQGSTQRRAAMLQQVTDLFIHGAAKFSEDEICLFDDVIIRLAAEIEVSVRALLAQRLAPLARAPIKITQLLASDDEIRVAGPVLTQSERLDTATLVTTARTKSQEHLLAISRRNTLSEELTDVLVWRGNKDVVLSAATNPGAKFSKNGFSVLVKRSDGDDALAVCIGTRSDIPHDLIPALLGKASEMVKAKLIAEHPQFKNEIEDAIAAVTEGIQKHAGIKSTDPATTEKLNQAAFDPEELTDDTVRTLAEEGNWEEIIKALALLGDVPIKFVEQAMNEHQSETLLILAKAAGLSWPTMKMLLSFNTKDRAHASRKIDQAMASFERLNTSTARQIIEFYRMRQAMSSHGGPTSLEMETKNTKRSVS